jgi:hypothetical protein
VKRRKESAVGWGKGEGDGGANMIKVHTVIRMGENNRMKSIKRGF